MKIEYKWRMLALLWVAFLLNQADRAMFGFVMPLLKDDLGLTDVQLGLVATTFHAFYGVLAPVAGFAGDFFRRSRVIFTAILTWSAATLATGFSTCIAHLILFRGASLSFGEAFYMPAANSLIGECHEKTKGTAMAIHQTALYCGMIGSGAVAGWLGVRYGWRSPFFIFGALGVLWAVVLFFGLKEPNARVAGRSGNRVSLAEAASRVFGSARILAMGVVFGCIVFCNVGYITWIPTLLHEKFGLSLFGFCRGMCDATFFPSLIEMIVPAYRSSCQGVVIAFGLLIGALAPIGLAWLKGAFGLSIGMASLAAAAVLGLALVAGLCISPNPNGKDKA